MGEIITDGLERVQLRNFRNYSSADIELGPTLNVLAAPNAQGKTNFLEAISALSTGQLLRGHSDKEAILEGAEEARIRGNLRGASTTLGINLSQIGRKSAYLNENKLPRASDLLGRLPSTCITLEDMALVRGEPSDRRLAMDLDLSALYPAYLGHLSHFKRALEQRNVLLRQGRETNVSLQIEPWEEKLAENGAVLRSYRVAHIEKLKGLAAFEHGVISDGEVLSLEYLQKDTCSDASSLLARLVECRRDDIERGSTSIGPHRDDLRIEIDGREARLFGSQGQQRTAVVAIKLAGLKLSGEILNKSPILLLDDILSDLDSRRREYLLKVVLTHGGQSVLTCTDRDAAGSIMHESAKLFTVEHGHIEEAQ